MARFMMFMYPPNTAEAWEPKAEDVATMTAYNEQLEKAGVLLALDGLSRDDQAHVTWPGGKVEVSDGPFAEAKELVGGYWIIQAKDLSEAVEWARKIPGDETCRVEVRRVFDVEDFSPEAQQILAESTLSQR